ncbi:unnamed protein product [Polarella glacialis]|uniref:Mitochondrial import inner membrane translocase subunit TIM50 n=1 Tax=Polarella glacialis TaxID=89957 RepID=A0A813KW82_POLGL|nr:unnamed protein product [Polarella glacialis]
MAAASEHDPACDALDHMYLGACVAQDSGEAAPVSPPAVVVRSLSSRLLHGARILWRDGDAVPPSRGHSPISYPQSTSNYKAVGVSGCPPKLEQLPGTSTCGENSAIEGVKGVKHRKPSPVKAEIIMKVAKGRSYREVSPEQKPPAAVVRPTHRALLPPQVEEMAGRKTLVLDLDETLVHSSFTEVPCEMVLTLVLGNEEHKVYVKKRPGVDEFLTVVSKWYEVVIFTASTAIYANALLDELDINGDLIVHRLFRQACTRFAEGYVKDGSFWGMGRHIVNAANLRGMLRSAGMYCLWSW